MLKGHDSFLLNIEFIPMNDQYLLSSSEDGVINVWNMAEQDPKQ
jgi:WD40 repeat protein